MSDYLRYRAAQDRQIHNDHVIMSSDVEEREGEMDSTKEFMITVSPIDDDGHDFRYYSNLDSCLNAHRRMNRQHIANGMFKRIGDQWYPFADHLPKKGS